MKRLRSVDLKRLSLKGYASILVILVLLVIPATATSSCPAGSSFPVTCYCADSSRTERITTQSKFLEARADPSSCCYQPKYNPKYVRPEHIKMVIIEPPSIKQVEPVAPVNTLPTIQPTKILASSKTVSYEIISAKRIELQTAEPPKSKNPTTPTFKVTAIKPDYSNYPPALLLQLKQMGFDI